MLTIIIISTYAYERCVWETMLGIYTTNVQKLLFSNKVVILKLH